MTLYIIQQ